ncbi:MAG: hypothetical protein ACI3T9_05660 [Romboutsia timonensis]
MGRTKRKVANRSMYKPAHIGKYDNVDIGDDPTLINYLALTAYILDENPYNIDWYLKDLYDKEEGDRRMAEIDAIRAAGGKTEIDRMKRQRVIEKNGATVGKTGKLVEATCLATGETKGYYSLKEMANDCGLNYDTIRQYFKRKKTDTITHKGYEIKRYDYERKREQKKLEKNSKK